MPTRLPATASDVATHVAKVFGQHMEIGCRLVFDGTLDPQILSRAVRVSLDAEPVLGCALRTGIFRVWWERLPDLDANVPFTVGTSADPDSEAIPYQTAAIDSAGPQVAVRMLQASRGDEVIISVNHDAADGQGVKQYAYVLADIYSRLLQDPSYVPEPNMAARPTPADVWSALSADQKSAANKTPKMTMPNWEFPYKAITGGGRTLRELEVVPERLRSIKAYGATTGASINALMLTAFFRAVCRAFPPPVGQPMSLPFTVDHRRYLKDREDIPVSNLAISLWLGVAHVEGELFHDTLGRVMEQLDAWRDAMWGAKSLMQATGLVRLGYTPVRLMMGAINSASAKAGKTSPVFTNIGVLDPGRLCFGALVPVSARLSGPAAFGPSLVPTISTYRDTLTVSMGFCEADIDTAVVDRVLGYMDEELVFS